MSGCSVDSTPDLSSTDSTGGRAVDAEHQATDLAVGVRIPRGEHHRVQRCSSSPAGARLSPGTGRQLDCVDNGGNDEPATWGWNTPGAEQDRNRRRWLPSN